MKDNVNNKVLKKWFVFACITIVFSISYYFIIKYAFHYSDTLEFKSIIAYSFIEIFILLNFIFDYNKIWQFLFKWRYAVGIILFTVLVIFGVHTSSVAAYNDVIQPDFPQFLDSPVWGIFRGIRSDEFLGGTPVVLSQAIDGVFDVNNSSIMAANGPVLLFPKAATYNISVLATPPLWGFLFLDPIRGFAFYSLMPYFLAFFASFEFLLLLTNKRKLLSLCGALMISFGPVIVWWNCQAYVTYGFICLLIFNKLLLQKSVWRNVIYTLILGWVFSCYIILLYPAWQIPFGYLFLIIAVWLIVNNKNNLYIRNFIFLPFVIIISAIIVLPAIIESRDIIELMSKTVYPGARVSIGGTGWQLPFQWLPSVMYGIKVNANPCETSQFICLYPIPFILGIYQIIVNTKNHKCDILLIFLTCFGLLLNLWNYLPSEFFSYVTFLYMSVPERSQVVVGLVCVLIIIRWIDKYQIEKFSKMKIIFGIVLGIFAVCMSVGMSFKISPEYYSNYKSIMFIVCLSSFFIIVIALLVINNKKSYPILTSLLLVVSIFSAILIYPLSVGLSGIYDKPISKEIQNIIRNDNEGRWISANASVFESNYILANGAKSINSINYYPQIQMWHKIDPDGKYENIYNRFAHILFTFTNEETSFTLNYPDNFTCNINANDVAKLDIDYVVSKDDNLEKFNTVNTIFEKLYNEDGNIIYHIVNK